MGSDPRIYNESLFVAVSCRDRIGELGRVLERWQSKVIGEEMARRLKEIFEVIVPVLRSVARIQLEETENPSACATVN
jgi:hypothetical protein